jgi:hypothetical protein
VAAGHDDSEHLLIAYSVVSLGLQHAPRPKINRVPVALVGELWSFHMARSAFRAAADPVLLVQNNAS